MYYEKLVSIYNSNDLQDLFPEISIDEFDQFIRSQVKKGNKFISPYKFALEQSITVNESVKFFIYFTGENQIFDILYYFDCSRPGCINNRIYLDSNDDLDEPIICEECGKAYSYNSLKKYIKVLFKIKSELNVPTDFKKIEKKNPNSTYDALKELPPHLKFESPSSPVYLDEGDEQGVPLETVFEQNNDNKGKPISNIIEEFKKMVVEISRKNEKT
ncbi:hypothetical protein CHH83_05820 [Bacillus sp. 7586-K]|nr:hypothetical protein CHH83_05820 [Bacillus sp. 7586-K]